MKTKEITITVCMILSMVVSVNAQDFRQTIKGQVIDGETKVPLYGATVAVLNGDSPLGTITGENGYFTLDNVPTGRVNLQVRFVGYNPATLSNVNLTSGKELQLNIELEEKVVKMEEVVVKGNKNRAASINEMTTLSSRTFAVEESQRYAGARNDVARMAANYAGVNVSNDALNDIVIRGNSSSGLSWRLDGAEIPNPNHFGQMGATGGPVSMLNNNLLSNSDFLTGAFPAEYGNATSGVFDLKMRSGNYDKYEFLGQVGFNGFEAGAEGPLPVGENASFLVNYRYSTLSLMFDLGFDVGTGTAVPNYQDLSFKLNIPTKNAGKFSIVGLGGKSDIFFENSKIDTTEEQESMYSEDFLDIKSESTTGVLSLSHTYIFNPSTYTKLIVGASGIENGNVVDTILTWSNDNPATKPYRRMTNGSTHYFANFYLNKKLNSHHSFKIGANFKQMHYNLLDSLYDYSFGRFTTFANEDGHTNFFEAYVQWQYRLNNNLTFNPGLHYQQLGLNSADVIEPRLGIKWKLPGSQTLAFGYGIHSKTHPLYIYFKQTELDDGQILETNKDIEFNKSQHFVLGYDKSFSNTLHFKTEVYYQDIFESAVEEHESSYSILNDNSFTRFNPDSLTVGGKGRNYGVELTLEKFLNKGTYYMFTASLFESKYKGSDGVWRNTAFNGNYVLNALYGKEFQLFKNKENPRYKKFLTLDGKVTLAGGQRYTPIDLEVSRRENVTEYDEEEAYTKKLSDYFRADVRFGFRLDGKKVSQEWAFDIQNVTNHKNPYMVQFDIKTGEEKSIYQLGFFPMMQYRIVF